MGGRLRQPLAACNRRGSLLDRHGPADLAAHLAHVHTRRPDCRAGLAGSLRLNELGQIRELAPGIAGFRGAACGGVREGAIDAGCVSALRLGLRPAGPASTEASR